MKKRIRRILIRNALLGALCLCLVFAVSRAVVVNGQQPISAIAARPFEPAEELLFGAEFSRALLRKLDVAELRFTANRTALSDTVQNGREQSQPYALTLSADIVSKGFFTKLFNLKFREQVKSLVEPVTFTVQKTTILDEQGKRVRATEATFDQQKGKISWSQRDPNDPGREPRNIVTEFSGQLQDVLSAIYFIRTRPLEVGKSFEIFISEGGRVYRVPVQVVEKKRMKTIFGKVNVLRIDPELFGPDHLIANEKGEFSIWLTDDSRHIPVGGRIKTDYGTFDIRLKKIVTNSPT
jgi:hypothetical protein